jgi:hypothetical protein
MMDRAWRGILAQYGQEVTVYADGQAGGQRLRAFLQPILERQEAQDTPSPLGLRREERFLYLGPANVPLTARKSGVTWGQQDYEVQTARPVGESHWWAVLRPREREAE